MQQDAKRVILAAPPIAAKVAVVEVAVTAVVDAEAVATADMVEADRMAKEIVVAKAAAAPKGMSYSTPVGTTALLIPAA